MPHFTLKWFFAAPSTLLWLQAVDVLQPILAYLNTNVRPQHHLSEPLCGNPRPHAWSLCAACFCPCISLSRATPSGRARYQTSEFLTRSEFPTELPTHNPPIQDSVPDPEVDARWSAISGGPPGMHIWGMSPPFLPIIFC